MSFRPPFDGGPSIALLLLVVLIVGCGDQGDTTDEAAQPHSKGPYDGQSIMVVAPKLRAGLISGPVVEEAKVFAEASGATIRVVLPGWNETVEKIRHSLESPQEHYDLFLITTSWSGPLFEHRAVAEIPASVKVRAEWEDILPIYRESVLKWSGGYYALPYDGDTVTLYYRKDLFEDADNRARFEAQFGYPLEPPTTWDRFRDAGRFFNGWDWDGDGEPEYGIAGSRLVNSSSMLIFLSRAAAYAKHPEDPAYYFDPDTMAPRIDSPGFVRALEEYVEALEYGPPGMINFAASDVRRHFIEGRVALAIDWANIGIDGEASPLSVVRGKVGYAPLPGAERVYDARAGTHSGGWDERPNAAASMVGNYLFLVNRASKNADLAFAFAAHMASREVTGRLVVTAGTGINPSRHSHLSEPAGWRDQGFSVEAAERYLGTIDQALANPNHVFDIRIPGSARYYKALDQALYRALSGERTAADALAEAASEWRAITDSLGRERQIELHRASLNLPPSTSER